MDPVLNFIASTGLPATPTLARPSAPINEDPPQKCQSVVGPDPSAEAALRRAARAAFFSSPDPSPTPLAGPASPGLPPVTMVERRTVTLTAARGTVSEKALNLAVSMFQLVESLSEQTRPVLESPPVPRFTSRSQPEVPRTLGRPAIVRAGEVFSQDGRGSSGFNNLTELANAIHCSYSTLVAKWHSAVQEQQIDPESHHGFEFVHKGHRVKVFPNYVPEV